MQLKVTAIGPKREYRPEDDEANESLGLPRDGAVGVYDNYQDMKQGIYDFACRLREEDYAEKPIRQEAEIIHQLSFEQLMLKRAAYTTVTTSHRHYIIATERQDAGNETYSAALGYVVELLEPDTALRPISPALRGTSLYAFENDGLGLGYEEAAKQWNRAHIKTNKKSAGPLTTLDPLPKRETPWLKRIFAFLLNPVTHLSWGIVLGGLMLGISYAPSISVALAPILAKVGMIILASGVLAAGAAAGILLLIGFGNLLCCRSNSPVRDHIREIAGWKHFWTIAGLIVFFTILMTVLTVFPPSFMEHFFAQLFQSLHAWAGHLTEITGNSFWSSADFIAGCELTLKFLVILTPALVFMNVNRVATAGVDYEPDPVPDEEEIRAGYPEVNPTLPNATVDPAPRKGPLGTSDKDEGSDSDLVRDPEKEEPFKPTTDASIKK
jgi:hypothetical protein